MFRRVSPRVRFVEQGQVCARPDCSRGVGRLSRFMRDSPFCKVGNDQTKISIA